MKRFWCCVLPLTLGMTVCAAAVSRADPAAKAGAAEVSDGMESIAALPGTADVPEPAETGELSERNTGISEAGNVPESEGTAEISEMEAGNVPESEGTAEISETEAGTVSESEETAGIPETGAEISLYARSAVLMDGGSGRVLYAKDADAQLPMASTTKLMTCILALELADEDLVCTASEYAAAQPQVKLGMRKGDRFYLKDLLYSLMLESHNDTAVCIAETVAGSVEAFAARMNEKAVQLGCTGTYFITPNGLDGEDGNGTHHTTARELALLMRYCLTQSPESEAFLRVTGTPSYSFSDVAGSRSYSCVNHNAFLTIMEGALSGKTGYTARAGYCYVGALKRDGRLLIVSLLACGWPNHKGYKWVDTKKLMNYGLSEYALRNLTEELPSGGMLPVKDGQQDMAAVTVQPAEPFQILMRQDETAELRLSLADSLQAPVRKGQQVGSVQWLLDGTVYAQTEIVAAESVGERDYAFCLRKLAAQLMGICAGRV